MIESLQKIDFKGPLLLLLSLALHYSNLSGLSIYALDEAKNATAAIEMWQNEEWIVPTFNGEYRFDKPPLHYYFFILAYQTFGITEFAARFFPALFGFLTTYITYRFARKNLGYQTGILSLLILTASLHWYIQFHMAVPDPFLIFSMTAGMLSFYEWAKSGFRTSQHMLITYACLGLAVMSKGPVGIVLPFISLLLFALATRLLNGQRLLRIFNPLGLLLFLLITLPWYIAVALETNGLWLEEFFFKHNLGRFSSPMEGHGGGFWLTLLFIAAGMLPFTFFLPQSIVHTIKFRTNRPTTFALICSGTIIVFFMLSGTKLPNYTVPSYPFLAILIGNYLYQLIRKEQKKNLLVPAILYAILIIALPFGIYYGLSADPDLEVPKSLLWLFMAAFSILPWIALSYYKNQLQRLLFGIGGGFMIISFIFFWLAFPKIDRQNPVVSSNTPDLQQEDLYYFKIFNPAFSFYLQRPLEDLEKTSHPHKAKGYLITRKKHLKELELLDIRFVKVFEGKDLFESPTTVVLKLIPDQ
ncbi:glycosyltransferase family 39 protein [Echinicola sediminis]